MPTPAGTSTADAQADAGSQRSLLIVSNLISGPGGSHTYSVDLSRHLGARGWRVIATSARNTRLGRTADMLWTTWRRQRQVSAALVDVFSGSAFRWAEAVTRLLRRRGTPIVLVLHGGGLPALKDEQPERVARLLQRATSVVAPSAYLAEQLGDLGVAIEVIPNAVDVSRYRWRERDPLRPEIVWLRAYQPTYAPVLAVDAFAALHATHPEARMHMAGPVKNVQTFQRVKAAIESKQLGGLVRLDGPVPNAEVPAWLDRGDVFLNTSVIDNTPVSLLEAMACGLCVVTSDAGGITHMVGESESALLAPSGDAEALAAALRTVLDDPEAARARAAHAREQVRDLDWSVVLEQWDRLLEGCLGSC